MNVPTDLTFDMCVQVPDLHVLCVEVHKDQTLIDLPMGRLRQDPKKTRGLGRSQQGGIDATKTPSLMGKSPTSMGK
jgi:hypothetical protein